jgi:hypothetical protein
MGYLMMNVDEIEELKAREKRLTEYLKKIEEWEAEVIMTDDCWTHGYCSLTEKLSKDWLVLQKERNELLYE